MIKFSKLSSSAVPLQTENIDTDQIIPARFLKATTREGFGENLFRDWRYDAEGKPKKDFVLNNTAYGGEILIVGRNFGCGSSREHAAWALVDYGFRVIVSSFFADIFKSNALNNYLLPVQVSEDFLIKCFQVIESDAQERFEVDLSKQTITINKTKEYESFDISPYKKMCLTKGFDDVQYLLSLGESIRTYETQRTNDYSLTGRI